MDNYIHELVSVIIPTYKRADLLVKAIGSVLGQTYLNIELLIVNDNVKDDYYSQKLYNIISAYRDSRLLLIEQDNHINGAAARNAGIKKAKGEYISFLDDDDYWEPQKIERQVELLKSLDESWGAVSCLSRKVSHGELILSSVPYKDGNMLVDILARRARIGIGAVLIRRRVLDECGYFDERLKRHQDLQLFARLALKYKIKLDKVYLYNIETKDDQNRPRSSQIKGLKADFFNSVRDIVESLNPEEQKKIFAMHDLEYEYSLIKEGNRKEGIMGIFKSLRSVSIAKLLVERVYATLVGKLFRNVLNKKYSI